MTIEWYFLRDLNDSAARSARVKLDHDACERYAAMLREWKESGLEQDKLPLPPLRAIFDSTSGLPLVYDGAHRRQGALYCQIETYPVDVDGYGTLADARRLARTSNRERGVPLSRADLNLQAHGVLDDEELAVLNGAAPRSNAQLAVEIGCSHTHVANLWKRRAGDDEPLVVPEPAAAPPVPAKASGKQTSLPPAPWPHLHLLGTMPDHDVANAAGVTPTEVGRRRRAAGIAAYKMQAPYQAPTPAEKISAFEDLFAACPDREIATMAGTSEAEAAAYRAEKGLPVWAGEEAPPRRDPFQDPQIHDVFATFSDRPRHRPVTVFAVETVHAAGGGITGRLWSADTGGGLGVHLYLSSPTETLRPYVLIQAADLDPFEAGHFPPATGYDFLAGRAPLELMPSGCSDIELRLMAAEAKLARLTAAAPTSPSVASEDEVTVEAGTYRYRDGEKVQVRTTTGDKIAEVYQDDEGDRVLVLLPAGVIPVDDRAHLASTSPVHDKGRHLWDILRATLVADTAPAAPTEALFDPAAVLPWRGTEEALRSVLAVKGRPWLSTLSVHLGNGPLSLAAWKIPSRCIRKLADAVMEQSKSPLFPATAAA